MVAFVLLLSWILIWVRTGWDSGKSESTMMSQVWTHFSLFPVGSSEVWTVWQSWLPLGTVEAPFATWPQALSHWLQYNDLKEMGLGWGALLPSRGQFSWEEGNTGSSWGGVYQPVKEIWAEHQQPILPQWGLLSSREDFLKSIWPRCMPTLQIMLSFLSVSFLLSPPSLIWITF